MKNLIQKLEIDEASKNALLVAYNDEQAKISANHKTELEKFKDYDDIKKQNTKLTKDLEKSSASLETKVSEHEALTNQIDTINSEWEGKYKNLSIDSNLKTLPNNELIKSQIDTSKIKWDENFNVVEGLSEQIDEIKGRFPGVFEQAQASGITPPVKTANTDSNSLTLEGIKDWSQDKLMQNWGKVKNLYN